MAAKGELVARIGRLVLAGVIAAGALAASAREVLATTYANDRNGFMIGFGVGGGSLGIQDGDEREGAGIGDFRIGYAVRPDLVLAFEGDGWTKQFTSGLGDVTWTFSTGTAALTWFPGAGGGYLRGGVGVGVASAELKTGGLTISDDESGVGVAAAAGYEWRLTRKFALGPQAEFFWMDLDQLGSANMIGGSLNFDWYW